MALTKIGTDGVKDDAVTSDKVANSINSAIAANTAKTSLEDESVTLAKLEHGTSSNDGKFLRANNGADPTFESLPASGVTVSNNTNNRVVTGDGTNLNAEANLTFDGSDLAVGAGNINVSKPAIPTVLVQNSTDTSYSTVKLQQSSGSGGYFAINKLGTNSTAVGGANAAQIWQSGNAPIIFGVNNTEEVRFQSGGGISFNGDTAAANALDDYEEGTWTPTWAPASGSINTLTAWGNYVKIGRVVHCMFAISANGSSGESGRLDVGGLPFTADVPSANGIRGGGGVAFPGAAQNQNITKVVANGSDLYVLLADNSFLQTNSSGIGFSYNAAQLSGMFTYLTS